jgi:allophanate hydrolase subunit 2
VRLNAVAGPRDDALAPGGLDRLRQTVWRVSGRSDRVGLRLEGRPLLVRDRPGTASEGVVRGAIQVPPGGLPVLFLADHPVTGGYPVVAVLADAEVDRAGQLRPGQGLKFGLLARPKWS